MSLPAPYLPVDVTAIDAAFGGGALDLMPAYRSVEASREWRDLQAEWFFVGLPPETRFVAKDGIDAKAALRHIRAIQRSWEPKHEHKEEAVAFLLGEWFESVITPTRTYGSAS